MNVANFAPMSASELEQAGALWTAREIGQQPQVWRRIAAVGTAAQRKFLAPLLSRPDMEIILSGAGTSAHVGECLAPALTRRFGSRIRAVATTDLVADPEGCIDKHSPLLLVSFARSGNSPESVAALHLAEQITHECHHLIITCNADGALARHGARARNSSVLILPEETCDRAFAMTSSFSSMLFSAALMFEMLTPEASARAPELGEQALSAASHAAQLARMGFERVVYLGDRELRGLAREAALKILELTDGRVIGAADTPLGFRHGPKTIIDSKTLVVLFLCNNPYTRAYEIDLLNELQSDGIAARVVALTAEASFAPSSTVLQLQSAASASELELCFPYAVFAQNMAMQASLALNLRPDSPNSRGVVNRVVQGVSVYPWAATP